MVGFVNALQFVDFFPRKVNDLEIGWIYG